MHRFALLVLVALLVHPLASCGGSGGGSSTPSPPPPAYTPPIELAFTNVSGSVALPPGPLTARIASIDASVGGVVVAGDGSFSNLRVTDGEGGLLLWLLDASGGVLAPGYDEAAPWSIGPDEVVAGVALLTEWGLSVSGAMRPRYLELLRSTTRYTSVRAGVASAFAGTSVLLDEALHGPLLADLLRCAQEAFERQGDEGAAVASGAAGVSSVRAALTGSTGGRHALTACGSLPSDVRQVSVAAGTHDGRCSVWALNPSSVFYAVDLQRDQDLHPSEPILVAPKRALINLDWLNEDWTALNPELMRAYPSEANDLFPAGSPARGSYQVRAYKGRGSALEPGVRAADVAGAANSIYAAGITLNLMARLRKELYPAAFILDHFLARPAAIKAIAEAMMAEADGSALLQLTWDLLTSSPRGDGAKLMFKFMRDEIPAATYAKFLFTKNGLGIDVDWASAMSHGWDVLQVLKKVADIFLCVDVANRYAPFFADFALRPFEVGTCFTIDGLDEFVSGAADCSRLTPIPVFTWSPRVPVAGEPVRFTAAGTVDDDTGLTYWWDFDAADGHDGDGGWSSTNVTKTFTYPADGYYTVTLRVSDGGEGEGLLRRVIRIGPGFPDLVAPLEVPTGRAPFDVVHGDFDADGDEDMIVSLAGATELSVLRGRGDGTFDEAARLPMPGAAWHLAVGDIDRDGRLDVAAGLDGGPTVALLRNLGGLSFELQPLLAVAGAIKDVVLADLDGASGPDLVFTDETHASVVVWCSDGTFSYPGTVAAPHRVVPVGAAPRAVAVGDLDLDSVPDLVVANFTGDTLSIARGVGGGAFVVTQAALPAGAVTYGGPDHVVIGDVIQGGSPEILVSNARGPSIAVFQRQIGAATLTYEPAGADWVLPESSGPMSLADLDGDGHGDLVRLRAGKSEVLVKYLPGTWPPSPPVPDHALPTGADSVSLDLFDANGDGIPDLVAANAGTDSVTIYLGGGGRAFAVRRDLRTREDAVNDEPYDVVVRRLYPDSMGADPVREGAGLDMAVIGHASQRVILFRNRDGHGDFEVKQSFELSPGHQPIAIDAGDLDGDGVPEVAVACFDSNTIAIYRRGPDGLYALEEDVPVAANPLRLSVQNVDGTGRNELVVMHYHPSLLAVYDYHAGSSPSLVVRPGATAGGVDLPHGLGFGQLDGDGRVDFVVSNYFSDSVGVARGQSDGSLLPDADVLPGVVNPIAVAIGDVNHDSLGDVVVAGRSGGATFLSVAGGGFAAPIAFETGAYGLNNANHLRLHDMDGDQNADIIVQECSSSTIGGEPRSRVSVIYGDGDGTFPRRVGYLGGWGPICVALGDVNGDGKSDVVVCSQSQDPTGFARVVSILLHR